MAKKRGGLAGIWDRNKKVIKPLATTVASILGTPALGAAVGAAMGGLDREGKSGIGVDVGGALKGGLSGYGTGKIATGIAGAAKGAFGAGGGLMGAAKAAGGAALPAIKGQIGNALMPQMGALGGGDAAGGGMGGGGVPPWMTALAAGQVANAAALGSKSGDYAKRAMDTQQASWDAKAPLRTQGIAGMQAPPKQLPQLGTIGAVGNPFAPKG